MEMHQLRYVVAVARMGTFSRAAEHCHVSQPSLSQQILKLEDELGERLFDRRKREARLTPHGEAFLRRALRILEEVEAAAREASEAKTLLRGTLTLGVLPTIAPYFLPPLLRAFTAQYPGLEVVLQEDTTARLVKLLNAYEIDLALASRPLPEDGMELVDLFSEELWVALPPDHPLTRRKSIDEEDLRQAKLIVMKEGHCLGDQVVNFCERRELQPNIVFRSAQLETLQALVRIGMGVSLVPEMATRAPRKDLPVYRPFKAPRPQRAIVLCWPRARPLRRAATAFVELIRRQTRSDARGPDTPPVPSTKRARGPFHAPAA